MRKNFGTKSWFYPLPVLVIGTYDENGNPDAMNAAWGGLYDADKVVLCLTQVDFLPSWPPTAFHLKEVQTVVPNVLWVRYTRP